MSPVRKCHRAPRMIFCSRESRLGGSQIAQDARTAAGVPNNAASSRWCQSGAGGSGGDAWSDASLIRLAVLRQPLASHVLGL